MSVVLKAEWVCFQAVSVVCADQAAHCFCQIFTGYGGSRRSPGWVGGGHDEVGFMGGSTWRAGQNTCPHSWLQKAFKPYTPCVPQVEQVECADYVVLNKTDLMDAQVCFTGLLKKHS